MRHAFSNIFKARLNLGVGVFGLQVLILHIESANFMEMKLAYSACPGLRVCVGEALSLIPLR